MSLETSISTVNHAIQASAASADRRGGKYLIFSLADEEFGVKVLKIPRLQDAYFKRFPDYPKGITVPAVVDVVKDPANKQALDFLKDRPNDTPFMLMVSYKAPHDPLIPQPRFAALYKETVFPRDVTDTAEAEAALAHVLGNKVEAAYQRGDLLERRRTLMDAWAAFCGRPYIAKGAKVVTLRGGTAA